MKTRLFKFLLTIFAIIYTCFNLLMINTYAIDTSNLTVEEVNGKLVISNYMEVDDPDETLEHQTEHMNERYNRYITVIAFVTGIAALTMMAIFIKHIVHFASLGTEHWIVRRNAMFGLLWSGIAMALLGSATLILALAYNAFGFF